jgi:hypothetical protein
VGECRCGLVLLSGGSTGSKHTHERRKEGRLLLLLLLLVKVVVTQGRGKECMHKKEDGKRARSRMVCGRLKEDCW